MILVNVQTNHALIDKTQFISVTLNSAEGTKMLYNKILFQ